MFSKFVLTGHPWLTVSWYFFSRPGCVSYSPPMHRRSPPRSSSRNSSCFGASHLLGLLLRICLDHFLGSCARSAVPHGAENHLLSGVGPCMIHAPSKPLSSRADRIQIASTKQIYVDDWLKFEFPGRPWLMTSPYFSSRPGSVCLCITGPICGTRNFGASMIITSPRKSGIKWHWSAEINPLFDGINSVKIVPSNVICRLPIWLFTWPSSMQVSCAKLSTNKRITILHHEVELYKMHSKILFVRSHYRKWAQVQ